MAVVSLVEHGHLEQHAVEVELEPRRCSTRTGAVAVARQSVLFCSCVGHGAGDATAGGVGDGGLIVPGAEEEVGVGEAAREEG